MELRKLKLLVVIWLFLLMALPGLVLADPNDPNDPNTWDDAQLIARTMREYQARRIYIYSSTYPLFWPSGGECPYYIAPAYPSDEYYQHKISNDPLAAMELVRDIDEKFYDWMPTRAYKLYGSFYNTSRFFVRNQYWYPGGTHLISEPNERYDFPDIPIDPCNITQSNYREVLETIYTTLIENFKVVTVLGGFAVCDVRQGDGSALAEDGHDCDVAISEADVNWIDFGWVSTSASEGGPLVSEMTAWYSMPDQYLAWKEALRCKFSANLSNDTGYAESWIRIEQGTDGWSNLCCWLEDVNSWQTNPVASWANPIVGEYWVSDYLGNVPDVYITTNCPNDVNNTYGWSFTSHLIYVWPSFDVNADVLADNIPDLDIYKNKDPNEDYVVYSANLECDDVSLGETVDGNVMPEYRADYAVVKLTEKYSTEAAKLYVYGWSGEEDKKYNGWNRTGHELTDPNEVKCYSDVNSLLFSVQGRTGETEISFEVTFWRYVDPNYYKSQKKVTLKVRPNKGDICCQGDTCIFEETIEAFNVEEKGVFCLYHKNPMVWVHGNNDIEVRLPDRKTESYIIDSPRCWFLDNWGVAKSGNTIKVFYSEGGKIYIFESSSPYKLTSITDLESNTLVTFEYDAYGRLTKQKDAADPNYYIAYDYNDLTDYNDSPETITAQAYDVNRVYTIEYDGQGRIVAMASASCDCGGIGAIRYVFNDDDLVKEKRSYDTNEVIYEYVYDSEKRRIETWLGPKSDSNCVQKVFYTEYGDGLIVDTYDYVDPCSYRVTREYQNSAGFVTKRIKYDSLDEDPGDPAGDYFTEHFIYEHDANGIVVKKTVIPPSVGFTDPPAPPISGVIRKEYTYDVNTGRLLTEKWFNANDANFTVMSYTYEHTPDGNNVRIKYSTDARGAQTEYFYDGNDVLPKLKIMPQVSIGISGTQRLKYEYTYDSQNRVILEKQLNDSNGILLQTKYVYDDGGNLAERYDDYGDSNEVTEYEYNGFNEMVMMTLPSDVINGWSYYDSGQVEYEVVYDPCDPNYVYSQTVYYYNGNGRLEEIEKADDPNVFLIDSPAKWIRTKYEYDLRGNKTKVVEDVNGLALVTTYEYNHQGEVTKVTLPNGKWTETVRDGRGLVHKTIVGHGETTVATTWFYYDSNGNLEWQKSPNEICTRYEYDDFDRLIRVTKGL